MLPHGGQLPHDPNGTLQGAELPKVLELRLGQQLHHPPGTLGTVRRRRLCHEVNRTKLAPAEVLPHSPAAQLLGDSCGEVVVHAWDRPVAGLDEEVLPDDLVDQRLEPRLLVSHVLVRGSEGEHHVSQVARLGNHHADLQRQAKAARFVPGEIFDATLVGDPQTVTHGAVATSSTGEELWRNGVTDAVERRRVVPMHVMQHLHQLAEE
mmetsp:Transcript_147299/g.410335  ORF Transcript_147299/g.410335 Transcript_147299/m.410335 type:complete len:208 (+) Transcript_147299:960-1583(+)